MGGHHRLTESDRIQILAFKSFFKTSEGTPEEKFVRAITLTSDKAWEKARMHPQFPDLLARLKQKRWKWRRGSE